MRANRGRLGWLLLALQVLPVLLVLWLMSGFAREAPFLDQWFLIPFFARVADGSISVGDIFARHLMNLHHVFVPRLMLTALAFATGWALWVESLASLLLAAVSFAWMTRWNDAETQGMDRATVGTANVLTAWFTFSLVQYFNWLWGFSFLLFLIHFLLVAAITLFTGASHESVRRRLLAAAVCCALASFTMHHGILTWFAVMPCVLAAGMRTGQPMRVGVAWGVATVVTCAIFLVGFPPQHAALWDVLEQRPLVIPTQFFNLLGMPAAFFLKWTFRDVAEIRLFWPVGVLLLGGFAGLCWGLLTRPLPGARERALPWISLGLFSIAYAAVNAIGRPDLGYTVGRRIGLFHAIYVTPLILLPIAVIQLALQRVSSALPPGAPGRSRAIAAVVGPFAVLIALNTVGAVRLLAPLREKSSAWEASRCFELVRYLEKENTCVNLTFLPSAQLAALEELGFRDFYQADELRVAIRGNAEYGRIDGLTRIGTPGAIAESTILSNGFLDLRDWEQVDPSDAGKRDPNDRAAYGTVRFPDRTDRPTTVLVSRRNRPSFIAWAEIEPAPSETSKGSAWYGWRAPIPDSLLGDAPLTAWVFDPANATLVRLSGQVRNTGSELGSSDRPREKQAAR